MDHKLNYIADPKVRKSLPKAQLLKDYLLDDLSSCSSNGFRSYPRRQCCTTVRFLVEIDLKNRTKPFPKSGSKSSSTTMSVLQRASLKVLNAVKSLPFAGVRTKKAGLPRSLSRRIFQRSFWRKANDTKEIQRWKSFGELIAEKPIQEEEDFKSTITAAVVTADSNSTTSSKSNSWSDSDFTASSNNLQCSSGNSEANQGGNDAVESKKDVVKRVGGNTGTTNYSVETTKEWQSEEKEHFSPVSVMDFPSDDDDNEDGEISSPFHRRLVHIEGTKKKLMHKIRRFESLAKLEPIDLTKRIALSESDHESSDESPLQQPPCSLSIQEEDEIETERKAQVLLRQMKLAAPSFSFKFKGLENLLLEFFQERLTEEGNESDEKLLDLANGWMEGEPREMVKGWEVQKYRHVYIRDMERGGMWPKINDEEKEEVVLELEDEIFTLLLDEICLDH